MMGFGSMRNGVTSARAGGRSRQGVGGGFFRVLLRGSAGIQGGMGAWATPQRSLSLPQPITSSCSSGAWRMTPSPWTTTTRSAPCRPSPSPSPASTGSWPASSTRTGGAGAGGAACRCPVDAPAFPPCSAPSVSTVCPAVAAAPGVARGAWCPQNAQGRSAGRCHPLRGQIAGPGQMAESGPGIFSR